MSATEAVLAALQSEFKNQSYPTYVVRNRLSAEWFKKLSTAQVLYRLKKLEAMGKVERVPSGYAVMICWRAKE